VEKDSGIKKMLKRKSERLEDLPSQWPQKAG
jgi:hypothetical protein